MIEHVDSVAEAPRTSRTETPAEGWPGCVFEWRANVGRHHGDTRVKSQQPYPQKPSKYGCLDN